MRKQGWWTIGAIAVVSDVVLEVNHRAVRDAADTAAALRQVRGAQVVFLLISRGGTQMFVSMRQP